MSKTAARKKPEPAESKVEEPAKDEAPPVEEKLPLVQLAAARFNEASYGRNTWIAHIDPNVKEAQILESRFWAHVADRAKPEDRIECWADDRTWMMELVVLSSTRLEVQVHKLAWHDLDPQEHQPELNSDYKVDYAGTHLGWRVWRKGEVIRENFQSKSMALRWASSHADSQTR